MKTFLSIFFGAVIGYFGAYYYYHTSGKISITETKTVTNKVVITVTDTQIVEQLAYQYIIKTNEVWKTNMVEKIVQRTQNYTPPTITIQKPAAQSPIPQQQVTPASSPTVEQSGLRGPRPAGKVKQTGDGKVKRGVKRNMDGSIKE